MNIPSACGANVRRAVVAAIFGLLLSNLALASPAEGALPDTDVPDLSLSRTITTTPFPKTATSMRDNEGSAYVPRDDSLWLADDDGRALYEVDATTGALKRRIDRTALEAVTQYGGGPTAGADRPRDLESLTYDAATDTLYAFSGSCCNETVLPTVFRLVRRGKKLQLESYQPLPTGSDNTASAWNPADRQIYVGAGTNIRTYHYTANAFGHPLQVPGVSGMLGMEFTSAGTDLIVTTAAQQLVRVDWNAKAVVNGWTFDLSPYGVRDARAVTLVGDQLYVSDGYDLRAAGDPLSHAVFVFDVTASTTRPTAAFSATPTAGDAPLLVQFTDTSSGRATSWHWDFGDGQTSAAQSPAHWYADPGTYTATLTASNANGSSVASQQIDVTAPPPPGANLLPNPDFESGIEGWDTNGFATVTLERTVDAHTGGWAAEVTNTGTTPTTNTLNDSPNAVAKTTTGTYQAGIWVRSDTSGAGLKLYLRIREFQHGSMLTETSVPISLTTSWQHVTATITPTSPGTSSIDFAAAVYSAPPGSTFLADDAVLTRL